MEKILNYLRKNLIDFYENFDISTISSIRLGGNIKLAIFPSNEKQLEKLVCYLYSTKTYFKVIGNVSNVLFVQNINYPVVITNRMSDELVINGNEVTASAGMLISKFGEKLRKKQLSGIEGLMGIPATIGGAIINNAGAFGYSIFDHLIKVKVFLLGKIFYLYKHEIKYGYHYSNLNGFIILSATFLFENKNEYDIINLVNEYTYLRGRSQPGGLSLGSVFNKVNNKSAGFYIERCGLKGTRVGGIVVSNKHSNFFINDKGGSAMDFLRLCAITQIAVEKQFGVTLVPEIEKVGERDEITGRFTYTFKR